MYIYIYEYMYLYICKYIYIYIYISPLARMLGAEESYLYIYICKCTWEAMMRGFIIHTEERMKRASAHKHIHQTTCLPAYNKPSSARPTYKRTNPTKPTMPTNPTHPTKKSGIVEWRESQWTLIDEAFKKSDIDLTFASYIKVDAHFLRPLTYPDYKSYINSQCAICCLFVFWVTRWIGCWEKIMQRSKQYNTAHNEQHILKMCAKSLLRRNICLSFGGRIPLLV